MNIPMVYSGKAIRLLDASLTETSEPATVIRYSISAEDLAVFAHALVDGTTIVVSGSTGAGKTVLAEAISMRTGAASHGEIRDRDQVANFSTAMNGSFDPLVAEIHALAGGAVARLNAIAGEPIASANARLLELNVAKLKDAEPSHRITAFMHEIAARNAA